MSFNSQNVKLAVAFKAQTALQTANVAADFWQIAKTNAGLAQVQRQNDSDAADFGKNSEFAQNVFPIAKDTSLSMDRRLSSEWAAWLFQYGFGTANTVTAAVGTGGNGTKYTVIQTDVNDGLDMPTVTVVEQLGTVIDRALVGMAVNDFRINFTTGPGRNNTMTTVNLVGCGKTVEPSTITIPATALNEHLLSGSNATVTLNGTSYNGANKSLMSVEATFNNNITLDSGYFIGSGMDGEYAIRGRMERGTRQYGLTFTARLESGSPELTALKNRTVGTATISLDGDAFPAPDGSIKHNLTLTYPKIQYSAVDIVDDNGKVTVQVTITPLEDATGLVCKAEINTVKTTPNIG